jgi:hypothetical protein
MFWVKNGLKMGFLGEKTTDLVFPATTVAGFWNGASDALFFLIFGADNVSFLPH